MSIGYFRGNLKKRILFLINPISGGISKKHLPELIQKHLDHNKFDDEIRYWTDDKNATEMTRSAVKEGFDVVVAAGGDGTINQVADGLRHSGVVMGILPLGSGNGLARHLRIPLKTGEAISLLNTAKEASIDTQLLNGNSFVNMAGAGFDAHIGHLFARATKRGFSSYTRITVGELLRYKAMEYEISGDSGTFTMPAFLVSFANGTQWGNNAIIAPHASVSDGRLDVAIMRKIAPYEIPSLAFRMFNGSIDKASALQHLKGKRFILRRDHEGPVHLDGEPHMEGKELVVEVDPKSLLVLRPQS